MMRCFTWNFIDRMCMDSDGGGSGGGDSSPDPVSYGPTPGGGWSVTNSAGVTTNTNAQGMQTVDFGGGGATAQSGQQQAQAPAVKQPVVAPPVVKAAPVVAGPKISPAMGARAASELQGYVAPTMAPAIGARAASELQSYSPGPAASSPAGGSRAASNLQGYSSPGPAASSPAGGSRAASGMQGYFDAAAAISGRGSGVGDEGGLFSGYGAGQGTGPSGGGGWGAAPQRSTEDAIRYDNPWNLGDLQKSPQIKSMSELEAQWARERDGLFSQPSSPAAMGATRGTNYEPEIARSIASAAALGVNRDPTYGSSGTAATGGLFSREVDPTHVSTMREAQAAQGIERAFLGLDAKQSAALAKAFDVISLDAGPRSLGQKAYDMQFPNTYVPGLSSQTAAQWMETKGAKGFAQFTNATLKEALARTGLDPKTTVMTPDTQRFLAADLIQNRVNQSIEPYTGIVSVSKLADNLANEWAAFKDESGAGKYDKDGRNKGYVPYADVFAIAHDLVAANIFSPGANYAENRAVGNVPAAGTATAQFDDQPVAEGYRPSLEEFDAQTNEAAKTNLGTMAGNILYNAIGLPLKQAGVDISDILSGKATSEYTFTGSEPEAGQGGEGLVTQQGSVSPGGTGTIAPDVDDILDEYLGGVDSGYPRPAVKWPTRQLSNSAAG